MFKKEEKNNISNQNTEFNDNDTQAANLEENHPDSYDEFAKELSPDDFE